MYIYEFGHVLSLHFNAYCNVLNKAYESVSTILCICALKDEHHEQFIVLAVFISHIRV